jgi:hypothetical protein
MRAPTAVALVLVLLHAGSGAAFDINNPDAPIEDSDAGVTGQGLPGGPVIVNDVDPEGSVASLPQLSGQNLDGSSNDFVIEGAAAGDGGGAGQTGGAGGAGGVAQQAATQTQSGQGASSSAGSSGGLAAAFAVGGVAFAALIVGAGLFLLRPRGRNDGGGDVGRGGAASSDAVMPEAEPEAEQEQEQGENTSLTLAVSAVAVSVEVLDGQQAPS